MKRARRFVWALAAGGAISAASLPARAEEPSGLKPRPAAPPDYPPPSARGTHLIAGAAMTAGWYGAAVGFSYLWPDAPGAEDLRIPVAGPWMALADTGCAEDDPDCSIVIVVLRAVLTTIDGVGQAGGVLIMAEGAFLPTRERRPAPATKAADFTIRPSTVSAGKDGIGIGVVGVF